MDGTSAPEQGFVRSRGMKFPDGRPVFTGQVRGALRGGAYEENATNAALRLVRVGDVVRELGAGLACLARGSASKVFCFRRMWPVS